MRERRRRDGIDDARDGCDRDRRLGEDDDLVSIYDRIRRHTIEHAKDAEARPGVDREVDFGLEDLVAANGRDLGDGAAGVRLLVRVRLECHRRKEGRADPSRRERDEVGRDPVALVELEREPLEWDLVGKRAEQKASVGIRVVLRVERVAALQRQIGSVHELFVETKSFRVDVIDSVMIGPVDDEHHVRHRRSAAGLDDPRQFVEHGTGPYLGHARSCYLRVNRGRREHGGEHGKRHCRSSNRSHSRPHSKW